MKRLTGEVGTPAMKRLHSEQAEADKDFASFEVVTMIVSAIKSSS